MGDNSLGQLGVNDFVKAYTIPQRIDLQDVIAFDCSYSSRSIAQVKNGTVFVWGGNVNGELGISSYKNQCSPQQSEIENVNSFMYSLSYNVFAFRYANQGIELKQNQKYFCYADRLILIQSGTKEINALKKEIENYKKLISLKQTKNELHQSINEAIQFFESGELVEYDVGADVRQEWRENEAIKGEIKENKKTVNRIEYSKNESRVVDMLRDSVCEGEEYHLKLKDEYEKSLMDNTNSFKAIMDDTDEESIFQLKQQLKIKLGELDNERVSRKLNLIESLQKSREKENLVHICTKVSAIEEQLSRELVEIKGFNDRMSIFPEDEYENIKEDVKILIEKVRTGLQEYIKTEIITPETCEEKEEDINSVYKDILEAENEFQHKRIELLEEIEKKENILYGSRIENLTKLLCDIYQVPNELDHHSILEHMNDIISNIRTTNNPDSCYVAFRNHPGDTIIRYRAGDEYKSFNDLIPPYTDTTQSFPFLLETLETDY